MSFAAFIQRHRSTLLTLIGFAVGLAVFIWLVRRPGMGQSFELVAAVGPAALWMALPYGVATVLFAIPWGLMMSDPVRPRWRAVVGTRFAAAALNSLIPSGVVGEPLRLRSVERWGRGEAGEALVWDRALFFAATGVYLAMTALILFVRAEVDPAVPGVAVLVGAAHLAIAGALVGLTRVSTLRRLAGKLFHRSKRPSGRPALRPRRRLVALAFTTHLAGKWVGATEVLLAAWLLGVPLTVDAWLLIAAAVALMASAVPIVPGQFGVMEAAISAAASTLGMAGPVGLAIGLLVRVRQLLFVPLGLVLMASPLTAARTQRRAA